MHGNAIARRSTALACALQIFVVVSPSICSPSFTPFLFLFFFFFYPLSFSSLSLSLIYARGIIRATYICLIKSVVRGALLTLRYVKNVNATSRAVEINSPVACFPAESVSRRREREREREREEDDKCISSKLFQFYLARRAPTFVSVSSLQWDNVSANVKRFIPHSYRIYVRAGKYFSLFALANC